ncbi:abhd14a protein [Pycnococcus provasolii]|uniref:Abhd14a protein n=2 Tax=Pycnococcus provasolii TaxID=41880 RepID=A0A830HRJ0_9CHLO|nr:abhd14a protein [Pycnococcus provasolii]
MPEVSSASSASSASLSSSASFNHQSSFPPIMMARQVGTLVLIFSAVLLLTMSIFAPLPPVNLDMDGGELDGGGGFLVSASSLEESSLENLEGESSSSSLSSSSSSLSSSSSGQAAPGVSPITGLRREEENTQEDAFEEARRMHLGAPPPHKHKPRVEGWDVAVPQLKVEESVINVHDLPVQTLRAKPEGSVKACVLFYHGMAFSASTWRDTGTLTFLASLGYDAAAVSLPGHGNTKTNAAFPSDKGPPSSDAAIAFLNNAVRSLKFSSEPVLVVASYSGEWLWPNLLLQSRALGEGGYTNPPIRALVMVAPSYKPSELKRFGVWVKTTPTLVVYGDQDRRYQQGAHKELIEAFGEAFVELYVMQDAHHAAYMDNPSGFNRKLDGFLAKLPAPELDRNGLF